MLLTKSEEMTERALSVIGGAVAVEIRRLASARRRGLSAIREIALRCEGRSSALLDGERVSLFSTLTREEADSLLARLCEGALYAYRDSISNGYLTLFGGIRVGVGGFAKYEHRSFVGGSDVRSLIFRIPGHECAFIDELEGIYRERSVTGMLIYSPPGVGKTTLLRGVISLLSSGERPLRTAVVDTRGELTFSVGGGDLCVDVLSGYPRALGIEIATRTLSAEVIVCDEIGEYTEAMALVSSHNCGVPLIASAHAGSVDELLRRTGIMLLHEANLFGAYVGIRRSHGMDFEYNVTYRDDLVKSYVD